MRGREKELDVALGMLRAAEAGRGGILLVEGEPGIGKSRFPEESAAAATARGFTLAWGQADARRMPGTRVLVPAPRNSLAGYDQTAALRDGRRVRRRLRGIGIRRRHFTHPKRPKTGWTSLTDTERAVSDLVAKGLTNQQIAGEMFLSTHTVAFHLRQVFRKLDISSRVDLARVFTEQAQLAGPAAGLPANGGPRQERAG